jgi:O-antigen/teichoic acid export membrane protein
MLGFSTWKLISHLQGMLKNQGVNILINIFFGATVNAANAIAYQVNAAIEKFSGSFVTAMIPQIIKNYATDRTDELKKLIFRGARMSFFLLMFISIPCLLETDIVLRLWLKNVPEYATVLTRLILIYTLIESYTFTVYNVVDASGKIRNFVLTVAGIQLLIFPVSYFCYKLGAPPSASFTVSIIIHIILIPVRLSFLKKRVDIGIMEYVRKVLLVNIIVFLFSFILPFIVHTQMQEEIRRFLAVCTISVITSILSIYFFGLRKEEKQFAIQYFRKKVLRQIK